jgi:hypothetical protein
MYPRFCSLFASSLGFLFALGLSLLLASCGSGGGSQSQPPPPPPLTLSASPIPLIMYPSTSFVVTITAISDGSATPMVTGAQLPTGITAITAFPLAVPRLGAATILLQTDATIAAGNYTLTFNGEASGATASASLAATLQTTAPDFNFGQGVSSEVGVPFGGSGQIQFSTNSDAIPSADYEIQLSVSGLPSGTTASVSPATIMPGQSTTVTVSASSTAPESQNVTVTLTGTPLAPAPPSSITFLVDVTPPPGSLPNNRTDYVSTEDTPYAAVYDSAHGLIFASNSSWNRVDVISATTHAIVTRIPLREPRGIDITQDNSTVWVASGSRQVFAINTSTFAVTRYLLPTGSQPYWEGSALLAVSDGTVMIVVVPGVDSELSGIAIWNPTTNAITFLNPNLAGVPGFNTDGLYRTGNGKLVYFIDSSSAGEAFNYNVSTQQFSSVATLAGYAIDAAVNVDGSRVEVCDAKGPNMYDGNFNLIGPLPSCGFGGPPFFGGGSVFSADNLYLYQEALFNVPVIVKIDANTLNVISLAPAMPMIPVNVELSQGYYLPYPFAVDSTGMILGLEDWGIAFDDSTYAETYTASQPGTSTAFENMSPYFGPLGGGTTSSFISGVSSITPTVWYGAYVGTASNQSALMPGLLTITSPPTSVPGPVNIKMLLPDGSEIFDPLFFSYGPYLQYALLSGAAPQGSAPAQVVGFGMPGDNVTGTLTVGGAAATLGAPGQNGLPFAGTPFPNKILSYTVPPGTPGWTDLSLTTPDGTSTLPKSFFYASSVTDYSSSDTFTAVLYDNARQQLYLSAGDHIDVFSLASNQFVTPLTPPAQGTTKLFAGLTLTPDGSLLLATDLLDGSLAVVNPDSPSSAYFIPVAPVQSSGGCNYGPLYVAALINNQAFVATGLLPGSGCLLEGAMYLVNLTSRTVGPPPAAANCGGLVISATADGSAVAFGSDSSFGGFCIYDVASNTAASNGSFQDYGAAFSGDGQVAASELVLTDSAANTIGRIARPDIYYGAFGTNSTLPNLLEPQLNAAGSLYYMAFANFFDIMDVQHAILRMRFSLSETVQNTAVPMAIDSGGRFVYLITNKGLTVVDLGQAPLSIGWLNSGTVSPGAQITVRGSGFNSSTSATVGGPAATVSVTDQNTLTLTIPNLNPGPATIILTNSDGTTYTAVGLLTVQ